MTTPAPLRVSFEFFPPKSEQAAESLWSTVRRLAPLNPDFVSVTYGAGGSTRDKTIETVTRISRDALLPVAAHLTCIGAPRAEIDAIAVRYRAAGIRRIVALRGDPPTGPRGVYSPHPEGYAYASDLVAGLKRLGDFEIFVAAYPEMHPQAASAEADLDNLLRKQDAGADRAITQFFFDHEAFLRFRDRAVARGVTIPLAPGLLPILNFARAVTFAEACGARIPPAIAEMFDGLDDDPETRQLVAVSVAADQVRALRQHGCTDFHFYTLNRSEMAVALCRMLGIRASQSAPAVATEAATAASPA